MIVKGHLVEKFLNDERFPLRINASFVASFGAEFGSNMFALKNRLYHLKHGLRASAN